VAAAGRTGLVVAGAGARGAYEAGALTVLLPRLLADDAPPSVLVGTSAGALNVVGVAGLVGSLGWEGAARRLVELWSAVRLDQVAGVLPSAAETVVRYAGQLLGLPVRLPSLLDTRRQRTTLAGLLPMDAVHEAVRSGPVDAVAVATTSDAGGGTVVFVEKKPAVPLPDFDPARNITYVATELTIEHVLASAAVPVAFRPVYVPEPYGGWYLDGGVRLNAPLTPALALGCRRLGVVATSPASWQPAAALPVTRVPDLFGAAALALRSLLGDRLVEDLHALGRWNDLAAAAPGYSPVPFLFAGPPPGATDRLGELAGEVFARRYTGLRGLPHPDLALLNRVVGGAASDHGTLLSFLLFEPPFTKRAARMGALDATASLAQAPAVREAWPTAL
jgi:NTE family protein